VLGNRTPKQPEIVMNEVKVAWIIGQNSVDQQRIRERGYTIKEFPKVSQLHQSFDEQPDLIIFSEADIKDFTILTRIRDFFPSVIILSMPPMPAETAEIIHERDAEESEFAQSMGRLLNAIRKIEDL
jgi:hypothetical protein